MSHQASAVLRALSLTAIPCWLTCSRYPREREGSEKRHPPTQVLLGLPFCPLLPALGQKHSLSFRTRVMCRFTIKATKSYRLPLHRGSYKKHVPGFRCCSLGRKFAVFFSLPQTRLGNALCSPALANDAFPEEDARLSKT